MAEHGISDGTARDEAMVFTDDMATSGDRLTHTREAAGLLGGSLRWLLTGEGGQEEAPMLSGPVPEEMRRLTGDLAQMRGEMLALAGRMGELEGRLRVQAMRNGTGAT